MEGQNTKSHSIPAYARYDEGGAGTRDPQRSSGKALLDLVLQLKSIP